jgi:hypothetical protein
MLLWARSNDIKGDDPLLHTPVLAGQLPVLPLGLARHVVVLILELVVALLLLQDFGAKEHCGLLLPPVCLPAAVLLWGTGELPLLCCATAASLAAAAGWLVALF